jgi:exonuclease I
LAIYLARTDVVVEFGWDWRCGVPSFKALLPIGVGRGYAGDIFCLDLARDPAEYASLSSEELAGEITIGSKPRPICAIRLNGVPIVFDHGDPLVIGRIPVESGVLAERAHRIRRDDGLRDRILDAVNLSRDRFEDPEHREQQLYSGGFFSDRDMTALERFHQVAPEMKLHVARTFDDTRLRYLAQRLIYEDWPAVLPSEIRRRFDAELLDRHLALSECRWTTLSAAIAEIDKLLPGADDRGRAILLEYRAYLMRYPLSEDAA